MKCKIFTSKPFVTPPIHLPFDRVRHSKVFEVVGIDLCGPLFLKNKTKVWIVIFTCAVYRGRTLGIVTNLSAEGFIYALRRFIVRRGRTSTIYSDNGINFRGTNNLLKSLNWSQVENSEDLAPIKWKFIPPTAAWWDGWWERLIRSVKNLLLRTLGRSSLNFEDLSTILCEVEAVMNNRLLTHISEESDKFVPLTPSSFIQDIQEIGIPDLEKINFQKLRKRYRKCQNIKGQLRNRFRKEYLANLVQKSREKTQVIQTGDVVVIELDNRKRLNWPIGKVTKLFPSRDGCTRVAEVKPSSGTFVRPIRKLCHLEISKNDDPVIQLMN
ncbi:uncharacterized protein LOC118182779 [Stegodyphus dumicola]|uniref:uncharacterized protein LOC118182779 n=1 Tax=Stegodyphus dumicola TaxID=202533 RepID=UPI0015AA2836|nr:uncharacterized protein LOC118182779 [Stegodyphus dumicola]